MTKKYLIIISLIVISLSLPLYSQTATKAVITPELKANVWTKLQPFSGYLEFSGTPTYGKICSLHVELQALVSRDSTEILRIVKNQSLNLKFAPDTLYWEAPIDSGDTFSRIITFTPTQVGSYQLRLGRKYSDSWQSLADLVLAIDEDGKTIYASSSQDCKVSSIPLHPKRDEFPVELNFVNSDELILKHTWKDFTADFVFHTKPVVGETTYVDFTISCLRRLYSKVQFVLDYSTNLKVSPLPESWGNRVAPTEKDGMYLGSFFIIPRRNGFYEMNFKIIGKHSMAKFSDRLTTNYPIYFVIGDDGELKFIGTYNPWSKFTDPADPMLGTLIGLVEAKAENKRLGHARSKPDYQAADIKAAKEKGGM